MVRAGRRHSETAASGTSRPALAPDAEVACALGDGRHRGAPARRRSRNGSAASATGTTASAGCATPRSPSSPWSARATSTKRKPGTGGCCARPPASPDDLQTMYGVAGERRLDEFVVPWLPGYEERKPGAGRKRRGRSSSSSTCTERCWPLSTSPGARARDLGARPGRSNARSSSISKRSGAIPTRASGRCAAAGGSSPTRR